MTCETFDWFLIQSFEADQKNRAKEVVDSIELSERLSLRKVAV